MKTAERISRHSNRLRSEQRELGHNMQRKGQTFVFLSNQASIIFPSTAETQEFRNSTFLLEIFSLSYPTNNTFSFDYKAGKQQVEFQSNIKSQPTH